MQKKFGTSTYDFKFAGEGTTKEGMSFGIHGHRASGTDGKQPMLMQTIILGIDTDTASNAVADSNIAWPVKRRVLESTLYYAEKDGWTRRGRQLDFDPELKLAGESLSGSLIFGGRETGELALTCLET